MALSDFFSSLLPTTYAEEAPEKAQEESKDEQAEEPQEEAAEEEEEEPEDVRRACPVVGILWLTSNCCYSLRRLSVRSARSPRSTRATLTTSWLARRRSPPARASRARTVLRNCEYLGVHQS